MHRTFGALAALALVAAPSARAEDEKEDSIPGFGLGVGMGIGNACTGGSPDRRLPGHPPCGDRETRD
jgi:hypothetical protein